MIPVFLYFVKVNSKQVQFQNMHGTTKCFKLYVSRNTEHFLRIAALGGKRVEIVCVG